MLSSDSFKGQTKIIMYLLQTGNVSKGTVLQNLIPPTKFKTHSRELLNVVLQNKYSYRGIEKCVFCCTSGLPKIIASSLEARNNGVFLFIIR